MQIANLHQRRLVNTITSPGGISAVTRTYTYELGKVKTITEDIDGVSNLVTFEYDSKARLYRKYFNGTSDYEQYDYDTNSGYLYRIQFTAAGISSTVWQLTNMDQYQRITQAIIGSVSSTRAYDTNNLLSGITATGVQGYTYAFDANTGNLSSRTNTLKTKTESFGYDTEKLDRLTSVTGPVNLSLGYTTNKNGNIESKSDAGTYEYDTIQPYAFDQITGGLNISNDQQTINYYSFEKVKKITEGEGAAQKTAEFDYNVDHQRIRMVLKTNGSATKTRWYFGGSCEREVVGGVSTQYIWIGGDAYTAVALVKKVGTGAWTVYNIFRDHLGTITHLKTGSTINEYSFDAWGRRRDKDTWSYTLDSEPALFVDRGFTAHEYLEDFKLYNMNGRLYDPVVGRFLSPDPYVQDPSSTQSFNRYSYCLNNPLKFTDPSGEIPWLYFAGQLLGNYLFGVADNTINKKMPMNQAAKQFNFNMNYSPGNNSFSTPGIDAQMAAWNMDSSQDPAYTMSGSWRQVNAYAGAYDDAFFQGTTWKYVPAHGQGGSSPSSGGSGNGKYQFGLPGTEIATIIDALSGFYKEMPSQIYPIISNHYGGINYKFGKSIGRIGTIANIYGTVDAANNLINNPFSVENWADGAFTGIGWIPLYGNLSSPLYMCGKDQVQIIQENIINNRNPLQGVYIPATGDVWYGW